jgi:hypothetical protein
MGGHAEYNFDTAAGRLFVTVPDVARLWAPGERVGIRCAAHGVHLVEP